MKWLNFVIASAILTACGGNEAALKEDAQARPFSKIPDNQLAIHEAVWQFGTNSHAYRTLDDGTVQLKFTDGSPAEFIFDSFVPGAGHTYRVRLPVTHRGGLRSTNVRLKYVGACSDFTDDGLASYLQLLPNEKVLYNIEHVFNESHGCSKLKLSVSNARKNKPVIIEIGKPNAFRR